MKYSTIIIIIAVIGIGFFFFRNTDQFPIPQGDATEVTTNEQPKQKNIINMSSRKIFETDRVRHSIPLDEIRQGCSGKDCIPSVDKPVFISVTEASQILPDDTVGIGLKYGGEERFYPFNMLVTREIVNDVLDGEPIVVTYCPLCGTGIVFKRKIGDRVLEFGVSGMLWQSNLLMYNRDSNEDKISLWSQVLGEAVLGVDTGIKLPIINSDIIRYTDWITEHPQTTVLDTGQIGDPYGGNYYEVARSFRPNFDESSSPIPPTDYVLGIEINNKYKAYKKEALNVGTTLDEFSGLTVKIEKKATGEVIITNNKTGASIPIIEGFWFSWLAVHPETELF